MGDTNNDQDDTGKARVDCYKTYGPKFVDCETESGWDCCFVGTAEDLDAPTDPLIAVSNKDPVDCYKTFGPNLADCQREWGWDCCFVDDPDDDGETKVDPLKDYDKPVSVPAVSDDQCALNYGARWYDCQRGYGLDCCLVDGVDQKDQTLWDHDWTTATETATATATATSTNDVDDYCAQIWGPEFYDCGRGYGLDCCVVDNGNLPTHDGEMMKQMKMNKDASSHVLRWFVLMAMMAFVVIKLVGRNSNNSNSNRRSFPRSGGKTFSAIPDDDDELDGDSDSDIELKPLI